MTREGLAWLLTFLIGVGCGGAGVIFYQAACRTIEDADVAISRRRHPSWPGHDLHGNELRFGPRGRRLD